MNNAKKQRKTTQWERLEVSSRKLEIPRKHSCKDGHNKGQKWYGPNRSRRYEEKEESKGMQLCATLWDHVDCSLPVLGGSPGENTEVDCQGQEYTEELYKKDPNDTDNHNGMITHLEPDILECEMKWALGSISTNNTSGGNGIPDELFQILKMML